MSNKIETVLQSYERTAVVLHPTKKGQFPRAQFFWTNSSCKLQSSPVDSWGLQSPRWLFPIAVCILCILPYYSVYCPVWKYCSVYCPSNLFPRKQLSAIRPPHTIYNIRLNTCILPSVHIWIHLEIYATSWALWSLPPELSCWPAVILTNSLPAHFYRGEEGHFKLCTECNIEWDRVALHQNRKRGGALRRRFWQLLTELHRICYYRDGHCPDDGIFGKSHLLCSRLEDCHGNGKS